MMEIRRPPKTKAANARAGLAVFDYFAENTVFAAVELGDKSLWRIWLAAENGQLEV